MEIFRYENGPFMVNTYLVINKKSGQGFILDPGSHTDNLTKEINEQNCKIEAILATHGHIDHVAGVNTLKKEIEVPFYMNQMDKELADSIIAQAEMFGVKNPGPLVIDRDLPSSGTIEVAGFTLELLHTPGHSKGSVSIRINNVVFSGDALFNMSIGRTDLPGGNYEELITSIEEKLFALPDDTKVLSGHGPETSIGLEKSKNPFFLK